VPSQFCGQNIGKYICAVVLSKEFYFDPLKSHFGTLKSLMEGKRFTVDRKREDLVMVQFNGPIIFVGIVLHVSGIIITHLQEHKTTVTTASGNRYTHNVYSAENAICSKE
jgi:hypothetical protein